MGAFILSWRLSCCWYIWVTMLMWSVYRFIQRRLIYFWRFLFSLIADYYSDTPFECCLICLNNLNSRRQDALLLLFSFFIMLLCILPIIYPSPVNFRRLRLMTGVICIFSFVFISSKKAAAFLLDLLLVLCVRIMLRTIRAGVIVILSR